MTASDAQEAVKVIASLLTTITTPRDDGVVSPNGNEGSYEESLNSLLVGKNNDHIEFSCPALSLVHDDPLNFNHANPKEAEKSAFQLLSRPMGFEVAAGRSNVALMACNKLLEVRDILLMNVNESFALLVDSRLRAHATFMTMHGLSVAEKNIGLVSGLDQKLHTLLEIGNRVNNAKTEMKIEVMDKDPEAETANDASSAIVFQVSMQLLIESLGGAPNSNLTMLFDVHGSLHVFRGGKTFIGKLEVDIQELLTQMKDCAAQVVAEVVEMTNSLYRLTEKAFHRAESCHSMPPPDEGSSDETSIQGIPVSPDLSACSLDPDGIPPLMLNNKDDVYEESDKDDVYEESDLSADQCASILDDVFCDVDIAVFSSSSHNFSNHHWPLEEDDKLRPSKKARTSK